MSFDLGNALHLAIRKSDTTNLERLLDAGINVDEPDWNRRGWAPLFEASQMGNESAISLLLSRGANPNASSAQGECPLHVALRLGHRGVVRLLLDAEGIDLNLQDNLSGQTPLHILAKVCASQSAQNHSLIALLKEIAEKAKVNSQNHQRETPLHRVAQSQVDSVPTMEVLLDAGADPDIQNSCGLTPLLCAIEKGHLAISKLLIVKGANLDIADRYGQTALHYASRKGIRELVPPILERKVNVNAADSYQDTSLHLAACKNYLGIIRSLLSHSDVDANRRNARGKTALHVAIESGATRAVRALLQAGRGNIHVRTSEEEERTALEVAQRARGRGSVNCEIITLIVEALRNQRRDWDKLGETVL